MSEEHRNSSGIVKLILFFPVLSQANVCEVYEDYRLRKLCQACENT